MSLSAGDLRGQVGVHWCAVTSSPPASTPGRRAQRVAETRQRIVEAAIDLHTTAGPMRTTISAIAERAGVQRHTLYAHFPDEGELFEACTGLWRERNPFPDVRGWGAVADPGERLRLALEELYGFYARAGADLVAVFDGADRLPTMTRSVAERAEQISAMAALLAQGRGARARRRTRLLAALEHALHLDTWRSLCEQGGLRPAEAVALLIALVEAADAPSAGGPP